MSRKRIGLVLASEETYPGAALGIIHQIQEFSRYTHSDFVGVVRGVGNRRGEVMHDPSSPSLAAGKSDFYESELKLFRNVKFASIQQIPIRIERQGNLAVEVGRQELVPAL